MMTDERSAKVEAAIAELEETSKHWTNQMVYAKVVGNYPDLAQYLKACRAGEGASVAVAEAEMPPPSLQEQLAALKATQAQDHTRHTVLTNLATAQRLSRDEQLEQLLLDNKGTGLLSDLPSL